MSYSGLNRMAKWLSRTGDVLYPISRVVYGRLAQTLRPVGSMLDVGCSFGAGTATLAISGFDTTGVDIDHLSLEMARGLYPWLVWEWFDISQDRFRRSFDYVVAIESLEHMNHQREALGNMIAVARRAVVIATPNGARQSGNPEHTHELTLTELRQMVEPIAGAWITSIVDSVTGEVINGEPTCASLCVTIQKEQA